MEIVVQDETPNQAPSQLWSLPRTPTETNNLLEWRVTQTVNDRASSTGTKSPISDKHPPISTQAKPAHRPRMTGTTPATLLLLQNPTFRQEEIIATASEASTFEKSLGAYTRGKSLLGEKRRASLVYIRSVLVLLKVRYPAVHLCGTWAALVPVVTLGIPLLHPLRNNDAGSIASERTALEASALGGRCGRTGDDSAHAFGEDRLLERRRRGRAAGCRHRKHHCRPHRERGSCGDGYGSADRRVGDADLGGGRLLEVGRAAAYGRVIACTIKTGSGN